VFYSRSKKDEQYAGLTITEIQEIQQLLQEDTQAQNALIILEKHHSDLEASFDDLW